LCKFSSDLPTFAQASYVFADPFILNKFDDEDIEKLQRTRKKYMEEGVQNEKRI